MPKIKIDLAEQDAGPLTLTDVFNLGGGEWDIDVIRFCWILESQGFTPAQMKTVVETLVELELWGGSDA